MPSADITYSTAGDQHKTHEGLPFSLLPGPPPCCQQTSLDICIDTKGKELHNLTPLLFANLLGPSQELVEHPFWKAKLPVLPLPAEPALEAFIKQHNLAPAQGDDLAANQVRCCPLLRRGKWAVPTGRLCCP